MRVVVVGAGLAGPALATGLAQNGHGVVLLEADASLTARPQGYRIHLDGRGLDSLRAVLPARSMALVEATAGTFSETRRLEVVSPRLRSLKTVATGPGRVAGRLVSTAVDRATLRAVLFAAAGESGVEIRWSARVLATGVAAEVAWAEATARRFDAELVAVSDGAGSRLSPVGSSSGNHTEASVLDTGGGSIVGRAPIEAVSPRLIELLAGGYVAVRGLRTAAGLGLMRFRSRPEVAGAAAGVPLPAVSDYLSWNVGLADRRKLAAATGPQLLDHAVRRLRRAAPDLRAVVAATDPKHVFLAATWQARRPVAVEPQRVTALGDAVHVMPPDRGSGANLALADAARLVAALADLDGRDLSALRSAVGRCEREMVEQAFAVAEAGPASDA